MSEVPLFPQELGKLSRSLSFPESLARSLDRVEDRPALVRWHNHIQMCVRKPIASRAAQTSVSERRTSFDVLVKISVYMMWVQEREFLIDNLLVRIHLIIEMILVDRHCAMGV